jgi:hypothetical protein
LVVLLEGKVYMQKIAIAVWQHQGKPLPREVTAALEEEGDITIAMFLFQPLAICEALL